MIEAPTVLIHNSMAKSKLMEIVMLFQKEPLAVSDHLNTILPQYIVVFSTHQNLKTVAGINYFLARLTKSFNL